MMKEKRKRINLENGFYQRISLILAFSMVEGGMVDWRKEQ